MILNIPPEIVNQHRLLTEDEISIYNLRLYMHMPPETYSSYTRQPLIDEKLGVPYYIDTNANIDNANELNENYIFYKKDYIKGQPYIHSLFIQHKPEDTNTHGRSGGKSKKRKTKKSKKNKTNKK
tara:strand:+ start:686 stop:1060 length:375 start_codon:yes stop_codon:yes gene_type:complete